MATTKKRTKKIPDQPPPLRGSRDGIKVRGMFRIQIENPDGTIAGDSGWRQNLITNEGYRRYLTCLLGNSNISKQVAYVALGTGGAPVATDNTLAGEIMSSTQRTTVTFASAASKSAQFTATFSSANSFLTASANLSNIGLFATTTTSDTLFAGNTYTSSACATNQNVNCTYTIQFS